MTDKETIAVALMAGNRTEVEVMANILEDETRRVEQLSVENNRLKAIQQALKDSAIDVTRERDLIRTERDFLVARMGTIYLIACGENPTKAVEEIARLSREGAYALTVGHKHD